MLVWGLLLIFTFIVGGIASLSFAFCFFLIQYTKLEKYAAHAKTEAGRVASRSFEEMQATRKKEETDFVGRSHLVKVCF